jgi:hypothetical protein
MLAGHPLSLVPTRLPVVAHLHQALATPDFMRDGEYIGFHLAHAYPHTSPNFFDLVPNMLKGVDMVMYEAFSTMGSICVLQPVHAQGRDRGKPLQMLRRLAKAQNFKAQLKSSVGGGVADDPGAPPSNLEPIEVIEG